MIGNSYAVIYLALHLVVVFWYPKNMLKFFYIGQYILSPPFAFLSFISFYFSQYDFYYYYLFIFVNINNRKKHPFGTDEDDIILSYIGTIMAVWTGYKLIVGLIAQRNHNVTPNPTSNGMKKGDEKRGRREDKKSEKDKEKEREDQKIETVLHVMYTYLLLLLLQEKDLNLFVKK